MIEIEQVNYGESCKGLLICTGELCRVDSKEIVTYFYNKYCNRYDMSDEGYLKALLNNIF